MKKINYHNNNEISISKVDNSIWADKMFFQYLIKDLLSNSKILLSKNFGPYNSHYLKVLEEADNLVDPKYKLLDERMKFFSEYAFYVEKESFNDDIFNLLNDFWINYEHAFIAFFQNTFEKASFEKRISAKDLCSKYKVFVMYRDMEEDVIWIEKNKDLMFPEINLENEFSL